MFSTRIQVEHTCACAFGQGLLRRRLLRRRSFFCRLHLMKFNECKCAGVDGFFRKSVTLFSQNISECKRRTLTHEYFSNEICWEFSKTNCNKMENMFQGNKSYWRVCWINNKAVKVKVTLPLSSSICSEQAKWGKLMFYGYFWFLKHAALATAHPSQMDS